MAAKHTTVVKKQVLHEVDKSKAAFWLCVVILDGVFWYFG